MRELKIVSVVGARPNFMKIAPIHAAFQGIPSVRHILVHSGQHYDQGLSGAFFRDLGLPEPDINLEVGSGSHAWQTAEIMKRLEPLLVEHKPDLVVVVGDVNSTVAAALTAAKLSIRLAHVEAGLRSFDLRMPEEINRRLTDALADFLFVTEESGVRNLRNEGIASERIFLVGNVMIDSLLKHRTLAARSEILKELNLPADGRMAPPYAVLTLHRPSNVDTPEVLRSILEAVSTIAQELPVFFPVHPRSRERIEAFGCGHYFRNIGRESPRDGLFSLQPLGYLDFLCLMDHARLVLTDSGGIQEETTVLGVPCLTLRENTERPATVEQGTNEVVGLDPERILHASRRALNGRYKKGRRPPLWDGQAAGRIVRILLEHLRPELLHQSRE
jgi:UDP-N-acetylglucosamine 2-epimerase (non-hydrolysing)